MDRITDDIKAQLLKTLEEGIGDDAMKHVKKKTDEILDIIDGDLTYRLKDDLAPMLAGYVQEMCVKTIDALLRGNEREIRRYLHCEQGHHQGRSDDPFWGYKRPFAEQHPIIHRKLHENSCVELRREIVDAHRDLITAERIKDLEDINKSLIAQVNKANDEKNAMWERVRALS